MESPKKKLKWYIQAFKAEWLKDLEFKDWLERDKDNVEASFCKFCKITLKNANRSALTKHKNSVKHKTSVYSTECDGKASHSTNIMKTKRGRKKNVNPKFKKKWERDPKLKDWVARLPGSRHAVYCKFCQTELQHWATRDLYKHANTSKHQNHQALGGISTLPDPNIFKLCQIKNEDPLLTNCITASDGRKITINLSMGNGQPNYDGISNDDNFNQDHVGGEAGNGQSYDKIGIEVQDKDWLEVSGTEVRCKLCNYKLKSTRLDVFKHSIGKIHSRRLSRKTGITTAALGDASIVSEEFRTAVNDLSYGLKCIIDLRTDSITTPSAAMKRVMKKAKLGDEYFHNDENINDLQETVATMLKKDAGLLFPSGVMANLVAVLAHCWSKIADIVMGDCSEMNINSAKRFGMLGQIPTREIRNLDDGTFILEELNEILFCNLESDFIPTTVVCVENTHVRMGGKVLPAPWLQQLKETCKRFNAIVHMDGSRFMNAALFYDEEPDCAANFCDSVTFGLDTGLGTPIGSVLVGSNDFIERAQQIKKMLGGTIHQMGMFAAAGIHSLEQTNIERLNRDHKAAKKIANHVYEWDNPTITVRMDQVETNIVHLYTDNVQLNPRELCERLKEVSPQEIAILDGRRVSILATMVAAQPNVVQLMTHMDLSEMDVELILKKLDIIIQEQANEMELTA